MTEDLSIPANVLLSRLVPLVSQDAQLLAILRGLAQEFLKLTEAPVLCLRRPSLRSQHRTARPGSCRPSRSTSARPPAICPWHRNPRGLVPATHCRRERLATYRGPLPTEGRRGTLGGGPAAKFAGWGRLLHRDRAQRSGDHQQGQGPGGLLHVDEPLQCSDSQRFPSVGGCCRLLRGGGDGSGPPAASDRERGEIPWVPRKGN